VQGEGKEVSIATTEQSSRHSTQATRAEEDSRAAGKQAMAGQPLGEQQT
jgi:hypothetical protein